jgi:quinol monooxygenase YgiN
MILVIGTLRLPPEALPRARAAMESVIAATRREDGCLAYSCAEDLFDPGLIHVSEAWRDQAALDRHGSAEHIVAYRTVAAQLGFTERNLMVYEAGEPRPL